MTDLPCGPDVVTSNVRALLMRCEGENNALLHDALDQQPARGLLIVMSESCRSEVGFRTRISVSISVWSRCEGVLGVAKHPRMSFRDVLKRRGLVFL